VLREPPVGTDSDKRLERRVAEAAEASLEARGFVSAIDVLLGLGWLAPSSERAWRRGRIPHLEGAVAANPEKVSRAMGHLRRWAADRGLQPSETAYVAGARERRALRFSRSGAPSIELAYRTHWVSPELSERRRERLAERQGRPPDLVVVSPVRDWACSGCGGTGDLLVMDDPGPLCLACAELDHLVYLPAGDAALTRRAKAASPLSAVVVRFSRARKRYERQGLLVEEDALAVAERRCLADEDARARRRERDADRRAREDAELRSRFVAEISRLFPGCPPDRAEAIARHAALRGSGRIGRTAAGRDLDPDAVRLAVVASIRHDDTPYDELLMSGVDRADARERVAAEVDDVLERWRRGGARWALAYVCWLYTVAVAELKDTRWTLRVTEPADRVVRAAALASHRNLTDFVIGAAVDEAERVLADRRRFVLDEPAWSQFMQLLDRPAREPVGLRELLASESVFE